MKVLCVAHNREARRCAKCRPHLHIRRTQLRLEKKNLVKCMVSESTLDSIENMVCEPSTSDSIEC